MGLAASSSQALRGGSRAALPPTHFLKSFLDPASPESHLLASPGLPGMGSTWCLQSLTSAASPQGPQQGREGGSWPRPVVGLTLPHGPGRHRGSLGTVHKAGQPPTLDSPMAHEGALPASWPQPSLRGQCVPRLHFCFSRGHSTMLSWGAQGFSGIEAH